MSRKTLFVACIVVLSATAVLADPPPSTAPPYRSGVSLQPIAIYDASGNIVSTFGGGSGGSPATQTTTGALQPPTAASGKIARTSTALAASTSTTIAAANANRIAVGIQCATGGVSVDETGGALTAAAVGNGTLFIPGGTAPYFTPPIATLTAVTAYTATAQTCVVTEYLR